MIEAAELLQKWIIEVMGTDLSDFRLHDSVIKEVYIEE